MPANVKPPSREICNLLPRILQTFATLGEQDAMLVAAMMRGETVKAIAARCGLSYTSVFIRWQKLNRINPAFGALATGLMGCGRGRKPKA